MSLLRVLFIYFFLSLPARKRGRVLTLVVAVGVIERDETVFRWARSRNSPITMVLSGGYQRSNAEVIANSLNNLHQKQLINLSRQAYNAPKRIAKQDLKKIEDLTRE